MRCAKMAQFSGRPSITPPRRRRLLGNAWVLEALLLLAVLHVLPEGARGAKTERPTSLVHPAELAAKGLGASCYYSNRFVSSERTWVTGTVQVLRHPEKSIFDTNMNGQAVLLDDVLADLNLEKIFDSNLSVLFGDVYFVEDAAKDSDFLEAYSGFSYAEYTLTKKHKYYSFFKDGKSKYSDVKTAFLTCVVPKSWALDENPELGLANGTILSITPQMTDFEEMAWNNGAYTAFFRYIFGLMFLYNTCECIYGLYQYWAYCTIEELIAVFKNPLICLVVNLMTSAFTSFIFLVDGFKAAGFLTVETFSAYQLLTRLMTMGTVLRMASHWMHLRTMIKTNTKRMSLEKSLSKLESFQNFGSIDYSKNGGKGMVKNLQDSHNTDLPCWKRIGWRLIEYSRNSGFVLMIGSAVCFLIEVLVYMYVKVLNLSVEDIWIFLLLFIALLELLTAALFKQQSSLFAKEFSSLVNKSNLASAENTKFLNRMIFLMRQCSFFLFSSVLCSIALGVLEFRTYALLWIVLWTLAIICRLGVGHSIVQSSFLNTVGRKKRSETAAENKPSHPVRRNKAKKVSPLPPPKETE